MNNGMKFPPFFVAFLCFFLLMAGPSRAIQPQLDAGGYHCLGLLKDGTVWVWGDNWAGWLGVGTVGGLMPPMPVIMSDSTPLNRITDVSAGQDHSLALHADGTVWAWGGNDFAQIGDGTTTVRHNPIQVMLSSTTPLTDITAVATGDLNSIALGPGGTVWNWGDNTYGQLGDGTNDPRMRPVQVMRTGTTPLTGIVNVAGGGHTLAVHTDGTIWAWGLNEDGQLGDGTTDNRNTPVQVLAAGSTPFTNVKTVAASWFHSLAVKKDGTVWAWGRNGLGQLGDGTRDDRVNPVQVMLAASTPLTNVIAVATGYDHSLALRSDGTVWAWGGNEDGQLADGTTTTQPFAVQVMLAASTSMTNITAITADGVHSHGIARDGTIWSWGGNQYFQLGDGHLPASFYAVNTSNIDNANQLAGANHSLAVQDDGILWAWGENHDGQLGDGTQNSRSEPVQSGVDLPLTTVDETAAGRWHSLAIRADNSLWSWGENSSGQLGDGTRTHRLTPVQVMLSASTPLSDALTVSAGYRHSVAILYSSWLATTVIATWGDNYYGQLGDGTDDDSSYPVAAMTVSSSAMLGFNDVAAGADHTLALHAAGEVWAWGKNFSGQLGDGSTEHRDKAVKVQAAPFTDLTAVEFIATGFSHSLAIKDDGSLWAWGRNDEGQLGNGSQVSQSYPVRVKASSGVNFSGASAICGGFFHTLALRTDRTVWAWGDNEYGQLGDGTNENSLYPVQVKTSTSTPLTDIVAIACGQKHSLAVKVDGTVWTWGMNNYGQLGDGSRSWYPVKALLKLPATKWHLFLPAIISGAQE